VSHLKDFPLVRALPGRGYFDVQPLLIEKPQCQIKKKFKIENHSRKLDCLLTIYACNVKCVYERLRTH
jgi:hypothetical protein